VRAVSIADLPTNWNDKLTSTDIQTQLSAYVVRPTRQRVLTVPSKNEKVPDRHAIDEDLVSGD
jgi:hypothetical protein